MIISRIVFFVDANPAAYRLLGYEKEELLEMDPEVMLFGNISRRLFNFMKEQFIETKQASHEMEMKTSNGQKVLVEIKSSMLEFQGEIYVLSTLQDIELKKEM
ncbi:PAS domain S-box protein [Bacillus salacetis]|uniref:PAS domain S-box protein n=1 Tax=Bacillus salacetis TaxID=2315464 RepID=UPI003BA111AC